MIQRACIILVSLLLLGGCTVTIKENQPHTEYQTSKKQKGINSSSPDQSGQNFSRIIPPYNFTTSSPAIVVLYPTNKELPHLKNLEMIQLQGRAAPRVNIIRSYSSCEVLRDTGAALPINHSAFTKPLKDGSWEYSVGTKFGNLCEGENRFVFSAYQTNQWAYPREIFLGKTEISIDSNVGLPASGKHAGNQ